MNQQNQSPLDQDPVYSRILELIKSGESNTQTARIISSENNCGVSEASIRRFRKRNGLNTAKQAVYGPTLVHTAPTPTVTLNVQRPTEIVLNPVRSEGWTPDKSKLIEHLANQSKKDHELVVVCGDQQAPFHDHKLHDLYIQWLTKNQPSRGVILGDLLDFPDVSVHPVDPDNVATVQECLQSGYDIVRDYVAASPMTQWDFLLGNHDVRIQRYIINKAPNVNAISRVITRKHPEPEFVHALTHLMRLDELGVNLVTTNGSYEDAQVVLSSKLAVRHGWKVSQGSGATALKTLRQTGYSIIIGHVHRQSVVYHTSHDINRETTTLVAAEAGCMCRLDGKLDGTGRRFPSYAVLPDWQNGFMSARIYRDGKFHLSPAIYVNETLLWEDQRYNG